MLKVERIVLKGFTGMGLHEIETFDFKVTSEVTIILGGNGCGKSSLLSVYFPLAPSKTEFSDGGTYTNYALVGDHRYRFFVRRNGNSLVCSIENLTTETMLVEEVNPKVYNSRVEELTGLNKEIKELINGEALLTRANTDLRRKWFTRLSTSDLSFALDFYKRLRKNSTMTAGALDHGNKKLADLKMRVVEDAEDRERLEKRLGEMELELNDLNKALEALPGINNAVSVHSIRARLERMAPQVEAILSAAILPSEDAIDQQKNLVGTWREIVASTEATVGTYTRELSLLMDESNRQDYLMRNHMGLKETIETLRGGLANHQIEHWTWGELPAGDTITLSMLRRAKQDARHWCVNLSGAVDNIKFPTRLREAESVLLQHDAATAVINDKIQAAKNVMMRLAHDREHFLSTEEVDCPKCNHRFRPGVHNSLESLEAEINKQQNWINELTVELETHQTTREEVEFDVNAKRQMRDVFMTYSKDPVVALLFKSMQGEDVFLTNRDKFGGMMGGFFAELDDAISYRQTYEQLQAAEKEWEEAVKAVGNVDGALSQKIERIRGLLDAESKKLSEGRESLLECQALLTRQESVQSAMRDMERLWVTVEQDTETTLNNEAVRHLNRIREGKYDSYATTRDRYRQMAAELANLASLEKEIGELQELQYNNRLMISSFSPEKGVLRRYLYNAVIRITEMMNKYIDYVWLYPMTVQPCDLTEGDMDYTFPYLLNNKVVPVPDVCKGSTAQQNMFNLAFRLTGYKALKLQKYPLLLDEPSSGMDEEHRHALVGFIKMLINSGEFSQVIVVSHDSDVHSKLNEAAYCVIDPTGVTLPTVYNEGVKIVYAD